MREFELLQHVFGANAALPGSVVIPPGDDMGAVMLGDRMLLVSVDQVADSVHVDLAHTSIERVGRKAITRNLSDVAAMAAQPVAAVAAASLPRDFGKDQASALFDAMRATAGAFDCPLIGGDVSVWDHPLVLGVTVWAQPAGIEPVLRQGAQVGDVVYVTGRLGGSLASGRHLDFTPRIALARALAGDPATRPHCMIDLSDGLASDLGHLCAAGGAGAGVGAVVEAAALPRRDPALTWQQAVGDGEDYELLFTAPPQARIPPQLAGAPITAVGAIVEDDQPRVSVRLPDGAVRPLAGGWEHQG